MTDITENFGTLYRPIKTLVVYEEKSTSKSIYVESYDMDEKGYPINAHPLTAKESIALANALDTSEELQRNFLRPLGLMPKNILHINPAQDGYAVWQTPAQNVGLFFIEDLNIPCGKAAVPPLIWKGSKTTLWVYAVSSLENLTEQTTLCHSPFFNGYSDGKVCMGTVKINIPADCLLEEFISLWQTYFFNSYFSHLLGQRSPVKGNIIQLWKSLIGTRKKFPVKVLLPIGFTLKKILS